MPSWNICNEVERPRRGEEVHECGSPVSHETTVFITTMAGCLELSYYTGDPLSLYELSPTGFGLSEAKVSRRISSPSFTCIRGSMSEEDSSAQSRCKGKKVDQIKKFQSGNFQGIAAVFVCDQPEGEATLVDQMVSDQSKLGFYG
ncbi:hypothetical protein F2Q68_00032978 [Brassica cretica]|uniref:Uncharacterized protein n=1 Tax=Brassica cretica TaxID=69181 RepID=A0A8S9G5P2_BRACR|nr:hypothetical protein F2Q68_00032978 [Brassica cretica]